MLIMRHLKCYGKPIDNPRIDIALKRNFNKSEQKKVKTFYCPVGFNYEKMFMPSKLMMKTFVKTHEEKKIKQRNKLW